MRSGSAITCERNSLWKMFTKRLDFKTYCKTCEHKDLEEKFDPCNDCLAEPMNANSDKPVYWKEAENGR